MRWTRRVSSPPAALLSVLVAGCYTYAPLPTLNPVPHSQAALVLSDVGRVGAGAGVGGGAAVRGSGGALERGERVPPTDRGRQRVGAPPIEAAHLSPGRRLHG